MSLRIIFMGTPDFAVPALDSLLKAGHEIPLVFTQPDKPSGRGNKIRFSPVKERALLNNSEVFQPLSLRKGEDGERSLELIKKINPDVIIVAAYGQILPKEILKIPRFGCINIHASLLPRWRGAAPVNFCIMNGDKISGVTIMEMSEGLDTGDALTCEECEIGENMTAAELHDRLKEIGARLITEFADNPEFYLSLKTAQDDSKATYAPPITKEMRKIDWNKPAREINNFIRALSGEAYSVWDGKRLKIISGEIIETGGEYNQKAGTITENLKIVCGDKNFLRLTEIKLEGKNRVSAEEFLRGYKADGILE